MVANQVIPSTNLKLVKGIQAELGLVIHQGKCIPWLKPNQFIIGWEPPRFTVTHWLENHKFNIELVIFQPIK